MSIASDYELIRTQIESACMAAVEGGLRDGLLAKIKEKAKENVYSYGAGGWAMSTRRGTIGDKSVMDIEAGGGGEHFYLNIMNIAWLQHPGGADEADVVEGGWGNYHQPGARKFMMPALNEFVGSGEADSILQAYLAMYGVT